MKHVLRFFFILRLSLNDSFAFVCYPILVKHLESESDSEEITFTYDVKYLVGQGREKQLEEHYLSTVSEHGKERNTLGKCA